MKRQNIKGKRNEEVNLEKQRKKRSVKNKFVKTLVSPIMSSSQWQKI